MSVDDDVVVVFNLMTESFLMTMIINPQLQLHIYTLLARETGVFRPIRCWIGKKKKNEGGEKEIHPTKWKGRMMGRGAV